MDARGDARTYSGESMPFMLLAAAIAAILAAAQPAAAAQGRLVVRILDDAVLYAAPGRPAIDMDGRLARERGSAWVLRRRGAWLQIPTAQRRDGSRGWIRRTPLRPLTTTRLLVRVDLSQRRVRVTRGAALLLSAPVAVGAPGWPSPVGATSISERIPVTPLTGLGARAYGPVVVALRMWQRMPSPAYPNGGLMAFHGGADTSSVGTASSAGCFRMLDADVRRLARLVRAGTPVIIRP
jgi:lipoprotein-anchoring transpeptidase ErfK/SrfK